MWIERSVDMVVKCGDVVRLLNVFYMQDVNGSFSTLPFWLAGLHFLYGGHLLSKFPRQTTHNKNGLPNLLMSVHNPLKLV